MRALCFLIYLVKPKFFVNSILQNGMKISFQILQEELSEIKKYMGQRRV